MTPAVSSVIVDPRTDAHWDALARTAQGSLFTSPPWIRSVCDTYGFTPRATIYQDGDGKAVEGFAWVPISDLRGDRIVSLPFSDRAEPFLSVPDMWSALAVDALNSGTPVRIRCLQGSAPTSDPRLHQTGEAAWHCTPLGAPMATLHAAISSAARRNIVAATRNGVSVRAVTGIEGVAAFHRLHVSLRKNKYRLLAQPLEFFERVWHEFSATDDVVTFLAYVEGEPIAGSLYLGWNDGLYYKFGASLAASLPLRPNDAIAWTALNWATERGFAFLDWGLSDLDQPGLIAFKRKWASTESRIVTMVSNPFRSPDRDHGSVLAEMTELLTDDAVPAEVAERAGALLYRYFA